MIRVGVLTGTAEAVTTSFRRLFVRCFERAPFSDRDARCRATAWALAAGADGRLASAAADGRLYLATKDGKFACFAGAR